MIIFNRLRHRLSNCFVSREMNHRVRLLRLKYAVDRRLIQKIRFIELQIFSRNLADTIQCFRTGVTQSRVMRPAP